MNDKIEMQDSDVRHENVKSLMEKKWLLTFVKDLPFRFLRMDSGCLARIKKIEAGYFASIVLMTIIS